MRLRQLASPRDMVHVAGDDAPADVPDEGILPVIGTAPQAVVAAQAAQSALDACPPALATPPRPFLLLGALGATDDPGPRDDQMLNSRVSCDALVLRCVDSTIARG
jgi:hypothetical protein